MTTPKENRGMTNEQKDRLSLAIFVLIAIFISLGLFKSCNSPQPAINYKQAYDSLQNEHKAIKLQFAYDKSQWEKEVTLSDQRDRNQQAQIIALQERSDKQTVQYKSEIEKIKHSAPGTCEPYIEQVNIECNKVINAKDDVIAASMARSDSLLADQMKALEFIKVQNEYIQKDSVIDAGKDAIMEAMLVDIEKMKKQARKGYFKGLLHGTLIGAAIKTGIDLLIPKQ